MLVAKCLEVVEEPPEHDLAGATVAGGAAVEVGEVEPRQGPSGKRHGESLSKAILRHVDGGGDLGHAGSGDPWSIALISGLMSRTIRAGNSSDSLCKPNRS